METSAQSVSLLLRRWSNGDNEVLDQLMPLVYGELRLMGQEEKHWENRAHFFGVAAKAMRHILVDYTRTRQAAKRGGGARAISLEEAAYVSEQRAEELVALDDALEELARLSPRQSQVVELRYFGGLSVTETAEALNVSPDTVTRDWNQAQAWLYRSLNRDK